MQGYNIPQPERSTTMDEIKTWFALRIKKTTDGREVDYCVNMSIAVVCHMTGTYCVNNTLQTALNMSIAVVCNKTGT